jgi:Fe-S cluster assembly scaffold protein SufB
MDIDLTGYRSIDTHPMTPVLEPIDLDDATTANLRHVGVLMDDQPRSGTYILQDHHARCSYTTFEGLTVIPIADAVKKDPEFRKHYYWHLIKPDEDQITRTVASQSEPQGFYLRVKAGMKVTYPYQAALYLASANVAQTVHNVVVLEEGAELELITGCLTHPQVEKGVHFAVTETYIGKRAKLTNIMVHSWAQGVIVRPRAVTTVDEEGIYLSQYASLKTGADIISNPTTYLNGKNASANFMSIILAETGSKVSTGSTVYLNANGTTAELKHRGVTTGGAVHQGGLMIGNAECKAHVDCSGMVLDPKGAGYIESVPGVRSNHRDARLSHEASIGKIAPEQVEYLMSRGFREHEAISLIIRGFLGGDMSWLGEELNDAIQEITDIAAQGEG